jgi:hypothetical protein
MTTNAAALDTDRLSPAEFDALKADAEAAADKAMRGTYVFDPLAEPVTQREVVDLFVGALRNQVTVTAVRADAIAQYERVAELAVSMGEGGRVCQHNLKRYSAREISDMAYTLGLALDKCAAGVAGYTKA